jgi:hypothetical protein
MIVTQNNSLLGRSGMYLNTNKTFDTMQFIDEQGLCAMDNICAFCITLFDGWNRFCPACKDYKGVMALTDFINTYGKEGLKR